MSGHGFHAVEVVGVGVAEALGKGEEIVVEHVLPSGGEGGDGAAVEGLVEGDDSPPSLAVLVKGVLAGQLDQALVALRAGVGEEHVGHARFPAQPLRGLHIGLSVEQIGDVSQLACLLGDGVHPALVGVAQGAHADAGGEVDVFPALGVPRGWRPCRGLRPRRSGRRTASRTDGPVL